MVKSWRKFLLLVFFLRNDPRDFVQNFAQFRILEGLPPRGSIAGELWAGRVVGSSRRIAG